MPKKAKAKRSASDLGGPPPGYQPSGPLVNGFHTIPEGAPLKVNEARIAPLTLPQEVLNWVPPEETIITNFKNGDKERKIHCNIELTQVEIDQLKALQDEAKAQGKEFFPSLTVMATRFISRARGDPKKALKLMCATQEWRADFFKSGPVTDDSVLEDLQLGIVYFTGRDKALRPTFVIRATRIPAVWYKEKRVDKLIRILIFCMEYFMRYMIVPGRVENNCVIVDLKGLGISQVPMGALAQVYNVMSHHYIGRVYRFYVCNLSGVLSTLAGAVKGLLTDRQRQKIVMCSDVSELQKEYALHHLEKDLGGTHPEITTFYPFPVLGGPFEAGNKSGERSGPTPGVHKVLTAQGVRGHLWDKTKTREGNLDLDYSDEAPAIFDRCGIPHPADLTRQIEAKKRAEEKAAQEAANPPPAIPEAEPEENGTGGRENEEAEVSPEVADKGLLMEDEEEEEEEENDPVVIQDQAVRPKGLFGCRACCYSTASNGQT